MQYTTEELARLWRNVGNQDIAEAYERLDDAEKLIEEIIGLCDQAGTKKDLVRAIKTALENSYVELSNSP